jgi:hypothetical protein
VFSLTSSRVFTANNSSDLDWRALLLPAILSIIIVHLRFPDGGDNNDDDN